MIPKWIHLLLMLLYLGAAVSCQKKIKETHPFGQPSFEIQMHNYGAMPRPDAEPQMSVHSDPWSSFLGTPLILSFTLIHNDSESSLTLSQLPTREKGEWKNGSIRVEGAAVEWRDNTNPQAQVKEPVIILPGQCINGRIALDDFYRLKKPGRYKIFLELALHDSRKGMRNVGAETWLGIMDHSYIRNSREGRALKTATIAIMSYYVDWSNFPPARMDLNYPALPPSLTTPVAYVGGKHIADAEKLAFFTNPYSGGNSWLVAGKGPDKDWDIAFLFKSGDVFGEAELLPYVYDPTNGAKSSGDILVRSSNLYGNGDIIDPNFRIWGYNEGKDSLKERTRQYRERHKP